MVVTDKMIAIQKIVDLKFEYDITLADIEYWTEIRRRKENETRGD